MHEIKKIVAFGSSITAAIEMDDENKRWLNILCKKLSQAFTKYNFQPVNSGIGGNSAREAMVRFTKDVLSYDPDYVILDLCANNMDPANPDRRVSLDEFNSLLELYIKSLSPKTQTLLFTTPPMYSDLHPYGKNKTFIEFFKEFGGFENSITPYRKTFTEFGQKHNFPIYDLYSELLVLEQANGKERYIYKDGIHLSEEGNKVLAEGMFELFKGLITA